MEKFISLEPRDYSEVKDLESQRVRGKREPVGALLTRSCPLCAVVVALKPSPSVGRRVTSVAEISWQRMRT